MTNCNTCPRFHIITNTVYTPDTSLVLTVTNSTNVSNRQRFCLCVNKNISNIVTGSPVPVQVTINGTAYTMVTKYGTDYPLFSDLLAKYYRCGRIIKGYYVNNGTTGYVITDVPHCDCANITGGK